MKLMPARAALDRYEAVRHRLPSARPRGAAAHVDNLSALADRFDTFFLDAFGVLNVGDVAIPGAPERIAALQGAGKRVMVLTNAASVPHGELVAKYARLGFDFAPHDVVSSRDVLMAQFATLTGQTWGVMAPPALQGGALGDLPLVQLGDDGAVYDRVDGFLMLGSAGWRDTHQMLLTDSLRTAPRPVWVGNPDIVAPRENGFSIEPGYYAHALADTLGIEPRFFGKPFGNIYDFAFARLPAQTDRARVLMVGDSLHTDILGAQSAGVASALITGHGFLTGMDVGREINATGIVPDFIMQHP